MQQVSSVISTEMVAVYFALPYVYLFFNIVETLVYIPVIILSLQVRLK